jgi:hypothetical protein
MTRRDLPRGTIDLRAAASLWSSRALPSSRVEGRDIRGGEGDLGTVRDGSLGPIADGKPSGGRGIKGGA